VAIDPAALAQPLRKCIGPPAPGAVSTPRKPTIGGLPGCCARAAKGQVIAALESRAMNSRRRNWSKRIMSLTSQRRPRRYRIVDRPSAGMPEEEDSHHHRVDARLRRAEHATGLHFAGKCRPCEATV